MSIPYILRRHEVSVNVRSMTGALSADVVSIPYILQRHEVSVSVRICRLDMQVGTIFFDRKSKQLLGFA